MEKILVHENRRKKRSGKVIQAGRGRKEKRTERVNQGRQERMSNEKQNSLRNVKKAHAQE